jgi:hypothetical protein
MAKKIDQPFIRVHENMPEHPKVEPLSDKAFRLLVETWCWSKRAKTNGHVSNAVWNKRGTTKTRRELVDAGLVDNDLTGGVIVHDFDDWQMTTVDIEEKQIARAEHAALAAHERWHVKRGVIADDCTLCSPDAHAMPDA